jgi:hypothetical protein
MYCSIVVSNVNTVGFIIVITIVNIIIVLLF